MSQNTVSVEAPHVLRVTAPPALTKHGLAANSRTSAVSDRMNGTGSAYQALQRPHQHLRLTPKVPPHVTTIPSVVVQSASYDCVSCCA